VARDGSRVEVRRAGGRARTVTDWLDSRHSFSFGAHYDPADTHFGLLVACNEDVIRPGTGYDTHPHRDVEILTWVLDGTLLHRDSTGHTGLVRPGLAQRITAGSGIEHSERNDPWPADPGSGPPRPDAHLVQMWVLPDTDGVPPGYDQRDITPELDSGDLVVVASGMSRHVDERAVAIRQRQAALHAARLPAGGSVTLPPAPLAHLFVARGSLRLEGTGTLGPGDAARVTAADGQRVSADAGGAEVLVWEMHASLT
jgi:redox-sensitive bicupin YhaK (pirin superfamily)